MEQFNIVAGRKSRIKTCVYRCHWFDRRSSSCYYCFTITRIHQSKSSLERISIENRDMFVFLFSSEMFVTIRIRLCNVVRAKIQQSV